MSSLMKQLIIEEELQKKLEFLGIHLFFWSAYEVCVCELWHRPLMQWNFFWVKWWSGLAMKKDKRNMKMRKIKQNKCLKYAS